MKEAYLVQYQVKGYSMRPWLLDGDTAIVNTKLSIDQVSTGDIVMVCVNNQHIAHRMMHKKVEGSNWRFTLKGDRLLYSDSLPDDVKIEGKVMACIRHGKVIHFKKNKWFWFLSITRINIVISKFIRVFQRR